MSDNIYLKHTSGTLGMTDDTHRAERMQALGWIRINRAEYRRLVREQARSHDYRATGESANEVEGE